MQQQAEGDDLGFRKDPTNDRIRKTNDNACRNFGQQLEKTI
jgi:hypothetical protein